MRKNIHPDYVDCKVQCGCGNSWQTRSTVAEIKIEVCSECHPFFRGGDNKLVDTLGRVGRFQEKFGGDYFSKAKQHQESKSKGRRPLRG